MNLRFLITAAVAAVSVSLYAQAGAPPSQGGGFHGGPGQHGQGPRHPGGMMGNPELQKQLNLTDAQKKKLKAIAEKYMALLKKVPEADRRTKGRELFQKMRVENEAVLTAKQKEILKKWMATHQPRFGQGGPGRGPGGKPGTGHGGR
ncbi:MAG TPA: hypothetical protein VG820_00115 [Fimbriimonadaceae bacterium]|nr:hypothetical protein [Fimbriimonadaceae bacterium]